MSTMQENIRETPPANDAREWTRAVVIVLTLTFALRMLALWSVMTQHGATSLFSRGVEMGFLARSVVEGHGLASPFGGNTGPTALIAPGYPLFVAGIFKLFGVYSALSAIAIMGMQLAANLLTAWFIMSLARTCFSIRAALIAGLVWACSPPLLWMPSIFWETSFSACILAGMLLFAMRIRNRPTRTAWLLFGVGCGLAALINMALLLTLIGLFCWTAFFTWRTHGRSIAFAACLLLLMYSPWPLRNAEAFHAFVPLRTTVGLELWMGNHDGSSGYLEESMFPMYNQQELQTYLREGELAYDYEKSSVSRAWIAAHPATFAKLCLLRLVRFWAGAGTRGGTFLFQLDAVLSALFGFAGLYLLCRDGRWSYALLFAIPLLLFPLPYYITHAEFRYRIVLDPLLMVLAGESITRLFAARARSAEAASVGVEASPQRA